MTIASKSADTNETPVRRGRMATVVLAAAVVAFIVSLAMAPSPAVDLFWQLRAGGDIVHRHAVPFFDDYTWTRPHQPWILHEWGMCVLLFEAYRNGGFGAVWLLQVSVLAATYLVLFGVLKRETGAPLTAACLTLWAEKVASPFLSPRPHLFTYLGVACLIAVIMRVRSEPTMKREARLWLLVPLCVVWANLHGGVVVGVGLIAAIGLCDCLQGRFGHGGAGKSALGFRLILVAGCCAAALLVNPYGVRIYQIFRMTVGNSTMPAFVSEWSALDFHSLLGLTFEEMAVLIAAGLAFSREPRDWADFVIPAILAHESLAASRNVPLFALAGLPLVARHIQSALTRSLAPPSRPAGTERRDTHSSLFGSTPPPLTMAVVAVAVIVQSASTAATQIRSAPETAPTALGRIAAVSFMLDDFPASACQFMRQEAFPTDGRLYNDYDTGGYILWRMPEYPVSISTQTDVYFGRVLNDYARLDEQPFGWQRILAAYHPDYVMLPTREPQSRLFAASPDWALCYVDRPDLDSGDRANMLIFVRRLPRFADLIARCRRDCPTLRRHVELLGTPLKD
ncbi:MAG: hypothetical protein ACLQVD_07140 [Capsulimonadaceae bacterium]